jgi:hypothetical protein
MTMKKASPKPKPPQGELISFAALKAERDIKRAPYVLTAYALDHNDSIKAGDIVLCALKGGGHTLAYANSDESEGGTMQVLANNRGDIKNVVGRVVTSVGVFAND